MICFNLTAIIVTLNLHNFFQQQLIFVIRICCRYVALGYICLKQEKQCFWFCIGGNYNNILISLFLQKKSSETLASRQME
jgi:hypothetical protein